MQYFNAVLDMLCDANMSMAKENIETAKTHIFDALAQRDISKVSPAPESMIPSDSL